MDENPGFDRLAAAAGVARPSCCNERDPEPAILRMDGMVFISGERRNREQSLKIRVDEKKFEDLNAEVQEP